MAQHFTGSELFDRFVGSNASALEIAAMSNGQIREQLHDLVGSDFPLTADDVATQIEEFVEAETLRIVEQRITDDETLQPYRDSLTYDFQEGREHLVWVATAPTAELIDWAQSIEGNI
jgi:hypothetical protein